MKRGLSQLRLARMREVLAGHVERGNVPGLVALVARDGDVHVGALGNAQRDTIFRIASITKPITTAAVMLLVEDCKLRLDDAVDRWLPELANRRVLKSIASELDDTVPARRAITVRDLLTQTLGFGSVMAPPDTYPIQRAIRELRIGGDGPLTDYPPVDEWLANLGSLPLIAQPGERWLYQVGLDVAGALVARVAGQSLGDFMRERIFEPLGMHDTAFFVPEDKAGRLRDMVNLRGVVDSAASSAWRRPPRFESGGGGLVGTIDDYYAFCRMLLDGDERVLSRVSAELMTSDHLTAAQRAGSELFFGTHSSWGFGCAVDIGRTEIYHTPGRFGWTGGYGTTAYSDPVEGLVAILFTQQMMESPDPPEIFVDFFTLAYAAME